MRTKVALTSASGVMYTFQTLNISIHMQTLKHPRLSKKIGWSLEIASSGVDGWSTISLIVK